MPNRTFCHGDVNLFTETCKKCGFVCKYKATSTLKFGKNIQMRLHKKTCVVKTHISKEELKKITDLNFKTMKTTANNTISEIKYSLV